MLTDTQRDVLRRLAKGAILCTVMPRLCMDAEFGPGDVVSDGDLESLLDAKLVQERTYSGSWWYAITAAGRAALDGGEEGA